MTGPRIAGVNNSKSRGLNAGRQRQAGTCQI